MEQTIAHFADLQIPLEDVLNATNHFHDDNIIGRGDFGTAYEGQLLRSGKPMKITARRSDNKHGRVPFLTEVSRLSVLEHPNLVSLIGVCDEKDKKVIITTYEAFGSLGQFLNNSNLTWTERLKICIGVANALSYLHSNDAERGYCVIHLNINSSTILLNENWEAKLSGFELSVTQPFNRKEQVHQIKAIGTTGYMDPAIIKYKGVTYKSDIYSFGVVLFEILCGREAYIRKETNRYLATLAGSHYERNTLWNIIPAYLRNQMPLRSLEIYSDLAYACMNREPTQRPNMDSIVNELKKALEVHLEDQLRIENLEKKLEHLKIHLVDIQSATQNFSETHKCADIDFCTYYRAKLDYFDKEMHSFAKGKNKGVYPKRHDTVVIKRYPQEHYMYTKEVLFKEIKMLSCVKHPNIVTLVGFCVDGSEMVLIIEDASSGGYLGDYLGDAYYDKRRILTWKKRLKICIDIARSLNYLHYEIEDQKIIINRNIKSHVIGLDGNLRAKISNFLLSLFMPSNQKDEALHLNKKVGTPYYIDPQYKDTGRLKRESDVYSFGVFLFEILCGRIASDIIYCKESEEEGLAYVARQSFHTGKLYGMIDPILKEETSENNSVLNIRANKDSLHTFMKIAFECVNESQDKRPTMKAVIKELEEALVFQEVGEQHKDIYQVVDQLEKTSLELQLSREIIDEEHQVKLADIDQVVNEVVKTSSEYQTHENILEVGVQRHDIDQVVDQLEEASLELQLSNENIHEKNLEHLRIRLDDIQSATQNFSEAYKITVIDACTYYRAKVHYFDKEIQSSAKGEYPKGYGTVVIKRYPSNSGRYTKEMLFREIKMLSHAKHPNIVSLVGFCVEGFEMILVTENLSYGYLADYMGDIHRRRNLTWEKRLKICIDIANSLNYLHCGIENQQMIINRNIKSDNIGLDENLGAKISDFFLSLVLPPNQENEALNLSEISGTLHYIDPEYVATGKLKRESDVYSFGVVLFEILCGRTAYDDIYYEEGEKGLVHVVTQSLGKGTRLHDMIDPIVKEEVSENNFVLSRGPNKISLHTFTKIAHECVAKTQDKRPTMKVVINELQKALSFQINSKNNPKLLLKDIRLATNDFDVGNYIGSGGFGKAYRGDLNDDIGSKTIVAKRLDKGSNQGENEFLSEIQILLEYKHENIIDLIGYCDEEGEKIIVYEYASNGSLDKYLSDPRLEWEKRLNICIDIASALYFLHGGDEEHAKVIHRDIKTANILLNNDWKAKLADFGLSLISPITKETDYVIDYWCGTEWYMDPLYKSGYLTIESDIYSFGVVLFEILCGKLMYEVPKHEVRYLQDLVKNNFGEGKHNEMVFKDIKNQIKPKSLATFQKIVYRCLHPERERRPTTKQVLLKLKKAKEYQISKGD